MTQQKVEIGVEAKLNAQAVEQGARKLDKVLGDVGRKKIDPVPADAARKVEALFQAYLKLDREMNRRLKWSNQQGLGPDQVDWGAVYQNDKSRAAKLRQLQTFLNRGGADVNINGAQQPQEKRRGGFGGVAAGVAQAGMRAAGPAGGVAANALGTGMSAGFGAGLMGLFGGMAALGVGKLVGAVTENIKKAEDNNIAYDRLKRTLGDVSVSFGGLKKAVTETGDGLRVTYDEAGSLATRFTKQGGLSGEAWRSLPEELGIGVGLSRSYGLETSQGVDFLGQMRGVRATRDTQDSRRMALLIGETIAKSDAFAKADEVMEAIAGFATAQTRQSMAAANVQGYAGMYSAMVGSGIAGLDPSGAAGILSRMNSSLTGGGANGEASQFFTSMVANRMGLDPLQMQVLREGGMFATKDQMFGVGSAYTRYMGQSGPDGGQTFYDATRSMIDEKYAGDSEQQKLMRAHAFGRHTGLNINQSMAMLSLSPNEMGELQKYAGDMSKLSGSGINNMAIARFGTDAQRSALAKSFGNRDDVSQKDKDALSKAMAGNDTEAQKDILTKLSAQYEQERTMGSDIRDSRALLDNIKTSLAEHILPALQTMRSGILYLAGNGKKTPEQVMSDIAKQEAKDRKDGIDRGYSAGKKELGQQTDSIDSDIQRQNAMLASGVIDRETYGKNVKALVDKKKQIEEQRAKLDETYKKKLEDEKTAASQQMSAANPTPNLLEKPKSAPDAAAVGTGGAGGGRGSINPAAAVGGAGGKSIAGSEGFEADAISEKLTPEERRLALSIYAQESGGGKNTGTSHAGAMGHMQMLPSTFNAFADKGWDINNPEHNRRAGMRYIKHLMKKSGGNARSAAGGYYGGEGAIRGDGSLRTFRDLKNPNFPDTQQYADQVMSRMSKIPDLQSSKTPLPEEKSNQAPGAQSGQRVDVNVHATSDPTVVQLQSGGKEVHRSEIPTTVKASNPNTYTR